MLVEPRNPKGPRTYFIFPLILSMIFAADAPAVVPYSNIAPPAVRTATSSAASFLVLSFLYENGVQ